MFLSFGFRVNLDPWRDTIVQAANKSLPYELSLDGDMEATLGFHPSVRLANISLSPKTDPDASIVSIGYVSAQVGLLPLLRNTIDIDHILMDSVDIHLKKDNQGMANWQSASDSIPEDMDLTGEQAEYTPASLPGYQLKIENKIGLNDLKVVYIDEVEALQFDAVMESLSIAIDAANDLTLNAHGTFQQEPWQVDSKIALDSILRTQQGTVSLKAALADAGVRLDGTVNLKDEENSELSLRASLPTTDIIEKLAGQDMSLLAPVSLKSRIVANATVMQLDELDIAIAGSELSGVIRMEHAELPIIEGSLTMDTLDLTPWLELAGHQKPQDSEKAAPQQSNVVQDEDEILSLAEAMQNWLNSAEIDFDLALGKLDGLPVEISDTKLAVTMNGGRLHAPASLTLAKIPLSGQLTMTANDNNVTVDTALTTKNANIGPLVSALLQEKDVNGHVDNLALKLSAEGDTASELIRNALLDAELNNGTLNIDSEQLWKLDAINASIGMQRDTRVTVNAKLLDIPLDLDIQADPLIGPAKRHALATANGCRQYCVHRKD